MLDKDIVVTREQVKDLIKSEGLKPSDLFDQEALGSDPVVRGYADGLVKERIGRAWREKEEAREELEKVKSAAEKDKAELTKKLTGLQSTAAKAQIGPLLEKQKAERKLDDRQMKFVQKRIDRFNPANPDELEKELNKHLDSEIEEYGKLAKEVFGIEPPAKDKPTPGGEPGTDTPPAKPAEKYLDPSQNEMIKLG